MVFTLLKVFFTFDEGLVTGYGFYLANASAFAAWSNPVVVIEVEVTVFDIVIVTGLTGADTVAAGATTGLNVAVIIGFEEVTVTGFVDVTNVGLVEETVVEAAVTGLAVGVVIKGLVTGFEDNISLMGVSDAGFVDVTTLVGGVTVVVFGRVAVTGFVDDGAVTVLGDVTATGLEGVPVTGFIIVIGFVDVTGLAMRASGFVSVMVLVDVTGFGAVTDIGFVEDVVGLGGVNVIGFIGVTGPDLEATVVVGLVDINVAGFVVVVLVGVFVAEATRGFDDGVVSVLADVADFATSLWL